MAVTVVQSIAHVGNPPATFGGNITAGNTVVIVAAGYTTSSGNPSTGTVKLGGGTVTGTVAFFNPGSTGGILSPLSGSNGAYICIWMLPNVQLGSQTAVDITFTAASGVIGQCIYEIAGLGTNPTLDVSNSGGAASGTSATSGASGAIASATEIVFGGTMAFSGTPSTNSGWICLQPAGGTDLTAGYQIPVSSGGSYTWSQTTSGNPWAAFVAAIAGTPPAAPAVYTVTAAPWRPPPPPGSPGTLVPPQVITGPFPPPLAVLASVVVPAAMPYLAPWQITPQVIISLAQTFGGAASLAGQGGLGLPGAGQGSTGGLGGQGSLGQPDSTIAAPGAIGGQGSLGQPDSTGSAGDTITGSGALGPPDSIVAAPGTITGQGSLAASTSPGGTGTIGGQGTFGPPDSIVAAPGTITGQGQLSLPAGEGSGGTLTGAGGLGPPDSIISAVTAMQGGGQLTGTGAPAGGQLTGGGQLGAPAILFAAAALAGGGQLAAATLNTVILGYARAGNPATSPPAGYGTPRAGTWP